MGALGFFGVFWLLLWFGLKEGELDWIDAAFLIVLWILFIVAGFTLPHLSLYAAAAMLLTDCVLIMKVLHLERY